ncbi:uncharacterized protein LOC116197751 [Punica granatum]|uniref:Fanconi Anaemia group E protein C-terminal domain-containing protein n=2 Tax=Punica granatum TaxID=22663 RepID=A0A218XEL0_PUNGR|nr:uncharacterized protein LOC116197751 [Punica granatum]OWM83170.1 hypothetical protein CDL15_Pgr011852 [Punica granatum]PKI58668.1 hypothetical protein CRG98_020934 [Punica granatum]
MERWVPLFNIFLHSPTPETDASRWLQESFNAASAAPITTASFLSLLAEPQTAIISGSSSSSPMNPQTKRIMFMQTLPSSVQSRILSFLAFEHRRFSAGDLSKLARGILSSDGGTDFWVERAARHLFDVVSQSNCSRVLNSSSNSVEEGARNEFEHVPGWLGSMLGGKGTVFPWLPVSVEDCKAGCLVGSYDDDNDDSFINLSSQGEEDMVAVVNDVEVVNAVTDEDVPLDPEIRAIAEDLRVQFLNFESTSRTVALANEIRGLCLNERANSLAIFALIEPWRGDDETTSILISNLTDKIEEDELSWPSQVLCSFVLPKFMFSEDPASRLLLTSVIEFCKLHQRAAEYGLVLPLILRKDGITNNIGDITSRVIRECLHPAHVTALCQKLFCSRKEERRFMCLPCHRCFISDELVWTEWTFVLLQNILNHNVHFTQDCVDEIVSRVEELSERFSESLKFGNFLLCLVTKCSSSLVSHKLALINAVGRTDTLVTKPVLSKLSSL